jgi:hypothetical protein
VLNRWHRDYGHLSAYTHTTMDKMILQSIVMMKDMEAPTRAKNYSERKQEEVVFYSYTAFAFACTLLLKVFDEDYGSDQRQLKFFSTTIETPVL